MQHTRTIKEAAAHYRAADPNTALTEYAIRTLVRTGRVPCARVAPHAEVEDPMSRRRKAPTISP